MKYSINKNKNLKLNKRVKAVFKKLKKYFKIIFLLIYFNLKREIYIKTNNLFIIKIIILL